MFHNYSLALVFCQLHIAEIADFWGFGHKQQMPLQFIHPLFSCSGAYHGLLLNTHLESVESFVFSSYSLFHVDSSYADAGDIVNVMQSRPFFQSSLTHCMLPDVSAEVTEQPVVGNYRKMYLWETFIVGSPMLFALKYSYLQFFVLLIQIAIGVLIIFVIMTWVVIYGTTSTNS